MPAIHVSLVNSLPRISYISLHLRILYLCILLHNFYIFDLFSQVLKKKKKIGMINVNKLKQSLRQKIRRRKYYAERY